MKKYCGAGVKRLLKLIFILIVFFFCFWLKNAVMWDAVYANNFRLSIKENRKIKKIDGVYKVISFGLDV